MNIVWEPTAGRCYIDRWPHALIPAPTEDDLTLLASDTRLSRVTAVYDAQERYKTDPLGVIVACMRAALPLQTASQVIDIIRRAPDASTYV
jgi:hypothetical protein